MFDFKISDDGELVLGDEGYLEYADKDILLRQQAVCRIKSVMNDWFNESELGANLEEFLGEVNNQDTATEVTDRITDALSDIIRKDSVFIVPNVNKENLSFIVFIKGNTSKTPIVINVKIDIVSGVIIADDIDTQ